jgi:Glutathione-dependent formaldehyde-activating enzyme
MLVRSVALRGARNTLLYGLLLLRRLPQSLRLGLRPFHGPAAGQVTVTGQVLLHSLKLADGRVSDRNHCAACGSLVFGGKIGNAQGHTIYAGTLDDPTAFKPAIGIFLSDKPDWVLVPPGLTLFDGMPRG